MFIVLFISEQEGGGLMQLGVGWCLQSHVFVLIKVGCWGFVIGCCWRWSEEFLLSEQWLYIVF